jgi:spermine/spermidine synthase
VPADRPHSALDVLYSTSPLLLSTPNTLLAGDRVCTGAQADDFAVAGLLAATDRVLLVGLAFGAAIRTLASLLPDVHVTAVDIDPVSGSICVDLYRRYFPKLAFDFVCRDALDYLRETTEKFDVICVDIYLPEGYPEVLSDPEFWPALRERLTPTGLALANGGGLPSYLRPWEPPSPQAAIASLLTRHWPNPRYLVNKRNITVLLESAETPESVIADRALRANQFTGADRAILSLLPLRLRTAPRVGDLPDIEPESFTRQRIEAELDHRWPELVRTLHAAADACGVPRNQPADLALDASNGPIVLRRLLDANSVHADFFAGAASSLAMAREPAAGWFGEWLCAQADTLCDTNPRWFVQLALPQALAMVACPLAPRWPWADRLVDLAVRVAESGKTRA